MSRVHILHLLACVLLSACQPGSGTPAPASCDTPRQAADALLVWQVPPHVDLAQATRCVDAPPEHIDRWTVQLKQVLDARGLYVPISTLPDDPDYTDASGAARVQPLPDVPMWLERQPDGAWRYTRATMEGVPRLYRETFSPLALTLQENLPPVFMRSVRGLHLWQGVFGLGLLAVAWILGRLVRMVWFRGIARLVARRGVIVDRAAFQATDQPVMLVVVFAILTWGLPQLQLPIGISRFAVSAADMFLRLSAIYLAFRATDVMAGIGHRWASRTASKLDDQLIPMLRSSANTVTLALGALVVFQAFGVDVWKLIAGASVGGLIVGLAAQDTVKNFFGSLNVFIDKPFQIGDWIIVGGVEGSVEEVGFRSTRIRTFYNSQVTVPNSAITNANVDNMGRRPRRRVKLVLGITYDTPPDTVQAFVEGIRAILAVHPQVEDTYEVHLNNLGDSSLEILVYYHLIVPDWHGELTTRAQNLLEFLRLAQAMQVSFAFPSTSVYVEATPDHPLPDHAAASLAELERIAASFGPDGAAARPMGPAFSQSFDASQITQRGS